ncbi:MAG: hypothetical protein ACJAR9_001836 [Celeribacter sp.]|jgi:hypothetical protein
MQHRFWQIWKNSHFANLCVGIDDKLSTDNSKAKAHAKRSHTRHNTLVSKAAPIERYRDERLTK